MGTLTIHFQGIFNVIFLILKITFKTNWNCDDYILRKYINR